MSPIFINGRFLTQRVTGVQRYAYETLLEMDAVLGEQTHPVCSWTLLVPESARCPALMRIRVKQVGRLSGHLWEQLELPWYARTGTLLNFGFTGPIVKANQIITVHDAAVVRTPESYSWKFRAWYSLVVRMVAARARCVFAVSKFSAAEATACFGIAQERIRITSEGWQHLNRIQPDYGVLAKCALNGRPYALAVSSPTPNKNFKVIAEALEIIGETAPHCVVVGAADAAVFKTTSTRDSLSRIGYVSDGELKALYQSATCFIFPSFYEGFGLPALEAMACGCPVIASRAAALKEVCGKAATYFDPSAPDDLAACIIDVFSNQGRRADMYASGLEMAKKFSWRQTAQDYIEALR